MIGMRDPERVILDSNSPRNERIMAIFKLGLRGKSEDIELIKEALFHDPSPCVRHEAAFALGETAAMFVVPDLIRAMETDGNPFVVHESALALGTLGDRRALEPLRKLTKHPNPDVSETAEIALERLLSSEETYS